MLPYLAAVVRDDGVEGAQEAFEGIGEPVFELGLRLLAEEASRKTMVAQLQEAADRELQRISRDFHRAIAGMAAIREGKEPREVGEGLRKL